MNSLIFQKKILSWYQKNGRKNLPWQINPTPYRVWVSEIMLQQTQVATVIPYYKNFMQRYPKIVDLAKAPLDDILQIWSGLGYYARARNLHKTAIIISQKYKNKFPSDPALLINLPGIGRSTAHAILSLSKQKNLPILDGNVKRFFIRQHGIKSLPNDMQTLKQLWTLAENSMPNHHAREHNQALMDIGALICTRTKPKCEQCPVKKQCLALQHHCVNELPTKNKKKPLPLKKTYLLLLRDPDNHFLLEKRPPTGIWGGLWCLPTCDNKKQIQQLCKDSYRCQVQTMRQAQTFTHSFSHFQLEITPLLIDVTQLTHSMMEPHKISWYDSQQLKNKGLPQPVKKILEDYYKLEQQWPE